MAATLASFTVTEVGSGTSIDPGQPSGLSVGELVALLFHGDGNVTPTWPTNFNPMFDDNAPAGDATLAGAWKIWEAGDGTEITFSDAGSHGYGASALRFTGFNAANPIHIVGTAASGTSTTPSSPGITTSIDDCLIVRAYSADGPDVATEDAGYPSSHTGLYNRINSTFRECSGGAAYIVQPSAGAVAAATWGALNNSQQWVGQSFAIAPAAAPAGNTLPGPTMIGMGMGMG